MDKCAFSDSGAAQNLVKILNDSRYNTYSPKVSKILAKYFTYTSYAMFIPNKHIRDAMLDILRKKFIEMINELILPEVVKTHTLNVIAMQYRKCIKEIDVRKGNSETMRRYRKEKMRGFWSEILLHCTFAIRIRAT